MERLTLQECLVLADHLGDTPTTVISVARLQQGFCRAYAAYLGGSSYGKAGESRRTAVLVFDEFCPDEPAGFGTDAEAIWHLLKSQKGWSCINVSTTCAEPLGILMAAESGMSVRYYGDVYYTLLTPIISQPNEVVRLLTVADVERLAKAPSEVQGNGYTTFHEMVTAGIAAGAIVAGELVALAHVYAETRLHVDIGVSTLAEWREKGFATAAAALVAKRVQEQGKVPVWSCGEDNAASRRVAEKLGFTEVARRMYVIPS